MPQMGESVTEGTILEWRKAVGDAVEADETLVEVSTDKVDAEVPSPAAGTIAKILVAEGDTVEVGQVLAQISVNGEAPATAEGGDTSVEGDPVPGTEQAAEAATSEADQVDAQGNGAPAAPAADGKVVDIVTPQAGESVTEGTILEWHKQPGDAVAADETIVEISTDKVDVELPAPAAGTLTEILAPEGETVGVGQVIARMAVGDGAAAPAPPAEDGDGAAADAPAPAEVPDGAKASPVARRAAADLGVDLAAIEGTGPGGRISKADVLTAAEGNGAAKVSVRREAKAQELKGGAAILARYMDESRSIPTATSFRTITVTSMDARRKELKAAEKKVSFTHLIAYAIARAATEEMPVMAHHFEERDGKPNRIDDGRVNLGIAVDVEKKDGSRTLMVPVIRDAGRLRFTDFLQAFNDLIARARDNKLTADDLAGANISLTNPGGIGTIASVPRLMPGQGTIVATGSIAYPVGMSNIGDMIGAEKVMTMTSTYDHRVIQGAESGRFLAVVEEYLQGEHGFYEDVFDALGVKLGPPPTPPAPAAAAAAARVTAADPRAAPDEEMLQAVQAATSLLKAHRTHGHLAARLDPLGSEPEGDPALDPEPLGLSPELLAKIPASILRMYVPGATLADALPHLRETYCGPIAYEIEHISNHGQRVWLREKIESGAFRKALTSDEKRALLKRLTEVDALERFMHKAYLGQKQFSVEGLDMTVPMLDELIQLSAGQGAREVVIGMAHRGRLNVLAHNLGRPYDTIFAEFEGASTLEAVTTLPQGGTGDVKYHHGAEGSYQLPDGESIKVVLESNPSHLEFVDPVVTGAARAAQTTRHGPHPHRDSTAAIPVILHGDASFPAQGVVSETLNLQALEGYAVGGTVHLIQNNQVGFTTYPHEARSTQWASDLAKGFDVPIIHVNADDVAACIAAVRLSFAFRQEFGHDVLIDLIGYRRYGHNEADEPAYTQPAMYSKIKAHPRVREIFAKRLAEEGTVPKEEADELEQEVWSELTNLHQALKRALEASEEVEHTTGQYELDRSPSPEVKTAVSADRLRSLNDELLTVPEGFTIHPKLVKQLDRRREALGADGGIDWAHAEQLAFASLLTEGTPIRLTGQDVERGTFSPAPHGAARLQEPPAPLPGAGAAGRTGADRAPQLAAVRGGVPGLRVRVLAGGAGDPGPVGGAVRRLRQQRPGDHRPVHHLGPGQVGPDVADHAPAAARLRGLRARALQRPARALPRARRRGIDSGGEPDHAGAVLPSPEASGADRQAASADHHDPEVAAAPAAGDEPDRAPVRDAVLPGARRAPGRRRQGHPAHPVHRQDLLRPRRPPLARGQRGVGRRPCGAPVSVPAGPDPRARRDLPEPDGGRVGPGGAAQHGRARLHVPAPDADPPRAPGLRLHRPPGARVARRGLPGRSHRRAEPDHLHRAEPEDPGVDVSEEGAGRAVATASVGLAAQGGPDGRGAGSEVGG